MARNILPGGIPEVAQPTIKMPTEAIDMTSFKEVGNKLIQSANTNFKLYANNQWEALSSEAYQQFGNDPVQLGQALNKIQTEILPNLPKEMADTLKTNMYFQSIGLVQRSAQNQINQRDIENKELAQASIDNADGTIKELYKNVLRNNIAKPEDKINETNAIYEQTLNNIVGNANIKNSAGKNVFTKTQQKAMTNFSKRQIEGFKEYFNEIVSNDNIDLEEANAYYNNMIRDPESFMKQSYMDIDSYDKAKSFAKTRITEAQKEASVRKTASLFTADDKSEIEIAKANNLLSKDTINRIVKETEKAGKKAYNPNKITKPTAFFDSLKELKDIAETSDDYSFDGRSAVIDKASEVMEKFNTWAETANPSDSLRESVRQNISQIILDSSFGDLIRKEVWIPNEIFGYDTPIDDKIRFSYEQNKSSVNSRKKSQAEKMALTNANNAMQEVVYRYSIGDIEKARELQKQARLQYVKDRNSYWIIGSDFDRLVNLRADGKKPVVCRDGVICEYEGIADDKMILTIKQ